MRPDRPDQAPATASVDAGVEVDVGSASQSLPAWRLSTVVLQLQAPVPSSRSSITFLCLMSRLPLVNSSAIPGFVPFCEWTKLMVPKRGETMPRSASVWPVVWAVLAAVPLGKVPFARIWLSMFGRMADRVAIALVRLARVAWSL